MTNNTGIMTNSSSTILSPLTENDLIIPLLMIYVESIPTLLATLSFKPLVPIIVTLPYGCSIAPQLL